MEYCTATAVTQFNLGDTVAQVQGIGKVGETISKRRTKTRIRHIEREEATKEKVVKTRLEKIRKENAKKMQEGMTYEAAGGGDL